MTTISQLPPAGPVGPNDELPIEQSGTCYAIPVSGLLAGTQPALTLATGTLLGRTSNTSGPPEQIALGTGLTLGNGVLSVTGTVGPAGPAGPAGPQGASGPVGTTGLTGPAGASMEVGDGPPATTLGSAGDSYLDALSGDLWLNENGLWTQVGVISGPAGPQGPQGPAGTGSIMVPTSPLLGGAASALQPVALGTGLAAQGGTIDVVIGTLAGSAAAGNDAQIIGAEQVSRKAVALGYAPLDANALVPAENLPTAPVQSVAGRTGAIVLGASDIRGLGGLALQSPGNVAITGGAVAANVSGASVAATLSPNAARSLGDRVSDVANVKDWLAISGGAAQAANAAFASLPASGGEIVFPAGTYTLTGPIVCSGKPVTIRGAGPGLTVLDVAHPGVGISVSQGAAIANKVNIRDLTLQASYATPSASAISVSYAAVSSYYLPTLTIADVEIINVLNAGGGAQSFTCGILLSGCWQPRLDRVRMSGSGLQADGASFKALTGTCFLNLSQTYELVATGCEVYYIDTVLLQTGYCEGFNFSAPIVVGCNWFIQQQGSFISPGALSGQGLWVSGGEIACYNGAFNLTQFAAGFVTGTEFTRYLDSGAEGWTAFALLDCQSWTISGCRANGGIDNATATFFKLTASGKVNTGAAYNVLSGNSFQNIGTTVSFGPGTILNTATGELSAIGATPENSFVDLGTGNAISWTAANGYTASTAPAIGFSGGAGQLLFEIANVGGAVNQVQVTPAATGQAPSVAFLGNDQNVGGTIKAKGNGGVQITNDVNGRLGLFGGSGLSVAALSWTGPVAASVVYAGPISGPAAPPGFRTLALDDLPTGLEVQSNRGVAGGYAPLDATGKVPAANLPPSSAMAGALVYQGTWDAARNVPAIIGGTGSAGAYFVVAVAGSTLIDGTSVWNVGDWIVFDGTRWDKLDGQANAVTSVAGRQGAVVLSVGDIAGAAPLSSPALSGTPTAPTPSIGDASQKIATTAFVGAQGYLTAATLPTATSTALGAVQAGIGLAVSSGSLSVAYGISSGTSAAGNDGRITGALQAANNLSDVGAVVAARNNLGLGTAATHAATDFLSGNQTIVLSGDATGAGTTAIAVTLASAGVVAGSYGDGAHVPALTVDVKGRVTAASASAISLPGVAGNQAAGTVFAGPVSGAAAAPGFRALAAADIPAIGNGPVGGTFAVGRWYGPLIAGVANVATVMAGRITALPWFVARPGAVQKIGLHIGTGSASSWNFMLGLYADSGAGTPGSLLWGSAPQVVAASASGDRSVVISGGLALSAGWYWLAFQGDTAGATLWGPPQASPGPLAQVTLGGASVAALAQNGTAGGVYDTVNTSFGAMLPATFGTIAFSDGTPTPYLAAGF